MKVLIHYFSTWYYCRYGLIWISTTLVFVLALLGNLATYLMQKHTDNSISWSFDVNYVNTAAWSIYGYVIVVPLAYYFFLQYMGSNANLIRFWCMWGYSLTIFILSSVRFCSLCTTCSIVIMECSFAIITLLFAQAHIGLVVFDLFMNCISWFNLILTSHENFSFYCSFQLGFLGGL